MNRDTAQALARNMKAAYPLATVDVDEALEGNGYVVLFRLKGVGTFWWQGAAFVVRSLADWDARSLELPQPITAKQEVQR